MKALSLFAALIFLSTFAQAFTLTGTDPEFKGWADADIKFNVNVSNCPASVDVVGLITEAAAVWNNVPTSKIKVAYGEATTSTTFANPPTVYCETNFASATGGADEDYVPAAANAGKLGGYAVTGILYLNVSGGQANIANFNRTKLAIIVAHEIGHVLGLGHSQVTNSLMYFDATYKATLGLSQDDMDGMSYLYPRNELSGDKPMGCGLVSAVGNTKLPPPPRPGVLALLMLLPVLVYFRLRRKSDVL
jgi:hypothetical protein